MPRRKTNEEFMTEMAVKNTKVTVIGTYVNKSTKILVRCNKCNREWMGNPCDLLKGHGCQKCYQSLGGKAKRKTNEQFLNELNIINSNIEPLEKYINNHTKIRFKCKKCGHEFPKTPHNVLVGQGCPKCAIKSRALKRANSLDDFIERMNVISPTIKITGRNYVNSKTKIDCECLVCGEKMKKTPDSLLRGKGCRKCSFKKIHDAHCFTQEEFERRMSKSNPSVKIIGRYYNRDTEILCECKKCGRRWNTKPVCVLNMGHGCPKCRMSRGEKMLKLILDEYGINYDTQHTFDDCVYEAKLKFDAFDLDNRVAYEYQGQQHYYPVNFGGCSDEDAQRDFEVDQIRDNIKREYCKEHNIPLIEIPYWERDNMRDFLIDKWKELNLNIA